MTEGAEKDDSEEPSMLNRGIMIIAASPLPYWELYVDGATN